MIDKNYFGEGKNIEFKREIPGNHEKFLKDIIAFSNSTGGKVIVGIEDETGTVYGIGEQSPFKLSDSISNMVSDACTPQIEPDISIQTIEEKNGTCHRYCSWKVQTLLYCGKKEKRLQLLFELMEQADLLTQEN